MDTANTVRLSCLAKTVVLKSFHLCSSPAINLLSGCLFARKALHCCDERNNPWAEHLLLSPGFWCAAQVKGSVGQQENAQQGQTTNPAGSWQRSHYMENHRFICSRRLCHNCNGPWSSRAVIMSDNSGNFAGPERSHRAGCDTIISVQKA